MTGDRGKALKRSTSCDGGDERGPSRGDEPPPVRTGAMACRPAVLAGRGPLMAARGPPAWVGVAACRRRRRRRLVLQAPRARRAAAAGRPGRVRMRAGT